jgi:hypothetical protein
MNTYGYLNALLDANPTVTRLVLATDAYDTATGPVPSGETDLATRVTLAQQPDGATPNLSEGYDAAGTLTVSFFC